MLDTKSVNAWSLMVKNIKSVNAEQETEIFTNENIQAFKPRHFLLMKVTEESNTVTSEIPVYINIKPNDSTYQDLGNKDVSEKAVYEELNKN